MLQAMTILLIFQLVGEVAVRALMLPIPGPVVGMLALLLVLSGRGKAPPTLTRATHGLLQHLSLLYIPAGVGVMVHLSLIQREWLAIALALVLSTTFTLIVTALTLRWLVQLTASAGANGGQ